MSRLQKVVRAGFVFWEMPPAPPQQQLPALPPRGRDITHERIYEKKVREHLANVEGAGK